MLKCVFLFEIGLERDVFLGGGVIRAEGSAGGVGGAFGQLLCFGEFAFAREVAGEIEAGVQREEMFATEDFFGQLEDLAILRFGFRETVLIEESVRQAAPAPDCGHVRRHSS